MTSNEQNETRSHLELDAAIDRALAQPPQPLVPADFAARVRVALPQPPAAPRRTSAARRTALISAAALLLAVFCIAPHTTPSFTSMAFDFELSLLAELACISVWLASPRQEL